MGEYQFTRCRKSQYDRIKYLIAEEYRWCLRETSDVFVAWLKVSEELIPCGALLAIEEEGKYQVVAVGPHLEEYEGLLCAIEKYTTTATYDFKKVYLIDQLGVERVSK